MEPFSLKSFGLRDNGVWAAESPPVPDEKLFVVEHISAEILSRDTLEIIEIMVEVPQPDPPLHDIQRIWFPAHFMGTTGFYWSYQFGSPARMYVRAGETIRIACTSKGGPPFILQAVSIGYLLPA
jgi:hypothetical protein